MVSWLRQMRTNFGLPFLWLIVLIYFIQTVKTIWMSLAYECKLKKQLMGFLQAEVSAVRNVMFVSASRKRTPPSVPAGFRSFVWMAVSFQLKDMLRLSPSTSQFLVSIAHSPWSIKPLYGILSDCIPIHGRKRLPYLILASLLSLVPWLILGLSESLRSSSTSLTIFLTIQNIGSAMADVVVDAMIAEAVRFERAAYAGDLQLISWSAMAVGGISGSLLGGYSLTNIKIPRNYILFSLLNSIQLLSCAFVKEVSFSSTTSVGENTADALVDSCNPAKTKMNLSTEYAPSKESLMIDDSQTNIQNGKLSAVSEELASDLVQREKVSNVNASVVGTDDFGTMRRRKKTKEVEESGDISMPSEIVKCHKKRPLVMKWLLSLPAGVYSLSRAVMNISMPSEMVKWHLKKPLAMKWFLSLRTGVHGLSQAVRNIYMPSEVVKRHKKPLPMKWLLSLRTGVYSLSEAFRQPIILWPMTWFFIAHVTVPNISISMFYYQTEFLHMDSSFVGTARVVGWCGLMLGSFIYSRFLKHVKLRRILMWAQAGLACLILLDIALVSRLNVLVGVSDKAMVLGVSGLADAVHQLKLMPFLIVSGRLCPPGIEGTLFALFMSINNLGSTLSSLLGAGLASALHIQTEVFDNLLLANVVRLICSFIPISFIFLIPEEATGESS